MIVNILFGLTVTCQLVSTQFIFNNPRGVRLKREFFEESLELIDGGSIIGTLRTTNPDAETIETLVLRVKRQDDGNGNEAGGDVTYSTAASDGDASTAGADTTLPSTEAAITDPITTPSTTSTTTRSTTRPTIKQNPTPRPGAPTTRARVTTRPRVTQRPGVPTTRPRITQGPGGPTTRPRITPRPGGPTTRPNAFTPGFTPRPGGPTTRPGATRHGVATRPTTRRGVAGQAKVATYSTRSTQRIGSINFPTK